MLFKYVIRNLNFLRSEKYFLVSCEFDISFTSYLSKMHIVYTIKYKHKSVFMQKSFYFQKN